MATIEQAVAAGVIGVFELPETDRRLAIRPLWVTQAFLDWADDTAELHDPAFALGGRTLFEHLSQWLCDFRCSEHPAYGDLRRLMPTRHGLWKMHPLRVRVYGWAPRVHSFVAVTAALESETKTDKTLNNRKRDEVREFIRQHGLGQTVLRGDHLAIFPHQN